MLKENLHNFTRSAIPFFLFLLIATVSFSQPQIAYQPVISAGLSSPIEVVTAPGDAPGRLFIVQQGGTVRIWNGTSLLPTPFINISSLIVAGGEQGLLSMAFHPQYQSNGFFYLYYNNLAGNITVSRFQVSANPDIANPAPNPATPLISIPKNFDNHNGGHLQFRVEGGTNYLYFATGDGGSANDPDNNAQDPASWLGKMIRMDVDAATPTPELWAWGLRNPFRWSFDRANGDIWIGDVGQGLKEEVNYREGGAAGANYGWACFEALTPNASAPAPQAVCDTVDAVHVLPIFDYDNPASGPSSVIGGYVYRGNEFTSLEGFYITGDFYSGQVWLIEPSGPGSWTISSQTGLPANIASFSESNDGSALYAVSLVGNTVYKVVVPIVTPLTLVNFSGKGGAGYNDLKWITESETNIDRFIVEYSSDATNWQVAGEVVAVSNGSRNTYSFRHVINVSSKLYYRLRVVETGRGDHYSPVIAIRGEDRLVARLYPTIITDGTVNIIANNPVNKITMLGIDGRQVMAKDMNGVEGYFKVTLPVLTKGIYILRIAGNGYEQSEKVAIQ